jgi:hypothetical protein
LESFFSFRDVKDENITVDKVKKMENKVDFFLFINDVIPNIFYYKRKINDEIISHKFFFETDSFLV